MWAEEDSPFGILPVELKWKIFGFLPFRDKKKARFVCSHWHTVIKERLKRLVVLTDWTKADILSCHPGHAEILTVRNLKRIISTSSLQDSIHQVDECVIGCGNFASNTLKILQLYSNQIKRLRIQDLSLTNVTTKSLSDVLCNTEWSNLSSLSVTIGAVGSDCHHIHSTLQIFKSLEVATLKTLAINFCKKDIKFKVPWNHIFDFILKNKKCLRELKLVMMGRPSPDQIQEYGKLSQFNDLNLTKFAVEYNDSHRSYASRLCLQMRGLIHLEIESGRDCFRPSWFGYPSDDKEYVRACNEFNVGGILDLHKKTLKVFRCQMHLFDLLWLYGDNGGGLESLRILEVNTDELLNIEMIPSLHNLRKCGIFVDTGKFSIDLFLRRMVDRMPKLEEVELFPYYGLNSFNVTHLEILRSLPWLCKITLRHIGSGDDSLKNFCQNTPGLSFRNDGDAMTGHALINIYSVQ